MTEATEFLVWRSALAETPTRLAALLARTGDRPEARTLLLEMAAVEAVAHAQLDAVLAGLSSLPDGAGNDDCSDPLTAFLARRASTLDRLDRVDRSNLHQSGRTRAGRELDPWRLAGNLADHDVRCLGALRRLSVKR